MYPNSAKHKSKKMFCSIVWIPNGKTKFGWCYINKIVFGAFGFGKPLKKSRFELGKGEKFTAHLYARCENTSYKKNTKLPLDLSALSLSMSHRNFVLQKNETVTGNCVR